ncbi:MAG: hypothetical protein ACR2HJ_09850 [Fimbriimonadales bacterium]
MDRKCRDDAIHKIAEVPLEVMKVSYGAFQIVYWDDPPSGSGCVSKMARQLAISAKDRHWQLKPSPFSAARTS